MVLSIFYYFCCSLVVRSIFAQYPPLDYDNPVDKASAKVPCKNKVSEDDCVRLLVAKAYSCETFTREQKIACQGTCNECMDDIADDIFDGPPLPASKIPETPTEEPTNDDFVKVDNYVDDYNEVGDDGVMPDHGQGNVPYMMHPGYVMPNMMYPNMYPQPGYAQPPSYPQPPPPTAPAPKRNPNAPGWAQGGGNPPKRNATALNPGGAIRGGKSNVNVPVLAGETLPGALLPLWSVVLICFGIILVLVCACWCSIKIHGAYLNRQHRQSAKRQQKESDVTIARLNTEITAMKAIAKEHVEQETERNKPPPSTNHHDTVRGQTNLATYPDQVPSYEEASNHPDIQSILNERYQQKTRAQPEVTKDDHIENLRNVKADLRSQREELDSTYGRINEVLKKYDDEPSIKPPPRSNKLNRNDIYEDHLILDNNKDDGLASERTSITGSSASTSDTITMISEKKADPKMPDFSNLPVTGRPPINNFQPKSSAADDKPLPNPLQELQKSRGPDYVNTNHNENNDQYPPPAHPEPKTDETLTNVTSVPPANGNNNDNESTKQELYETRKVMKGLQGMVRTLIGTVADQHDESQKIKNQIAQDRLVRDTPPDETDINRAADESDEIYQKTADPGVDRTPIALPDNHIGQSAGSISKQYQLPKSTTNGMPPLNNFRPPGTQTVERCVKPSSLQPSNITSMPLPPLPKNQPMLPLVQLRPPQHHYNKPPAPLAPSLSSLEKMHLDIQVRARQNGEPAYVNLKGPLDVGGPAVGGMQTPSPVPSESFIGQMTHHYQKQRPLIPIPSVPPPPEPSYQDQPSYQRQNSLHSNSQIQQQFYNESPIYENHSMGENQSTKFQPMTDGVRPQIFNENLSIHGSHLSGSHLSGSHLSGSHLTASHLTDHQSVSSYMTNSTHSTVHTRSRVSSMTGTSMTGTSMTQASQYDDSDDTQSATSVVEQSVKSEARSTRPDQFQINAQINAEPVEIPESRASMNNFVNRIPSAIVRERFQKIAETLNTKWRCVNHELRGGDDQASSLCKQMFALGLDILETTGNVNLISTGRGMGDMGSALAAIKPTEASTINTFTKNILFTAIYINKQTNGNEMFQTSLQSLLETTDQLMDLLSQLFQSQPSQSITQPSGSINQSSGYSMSRTVSDTLTQNTETQNTEDSSSSSDENEKSKADSLERTMTNQSKQMDDFEQSLNKLEVKLTKSMEEIELTPSETPTQQEKSIKSNQSREEGKDDDDDSSNSSESFETSSDSDSD